MFPINANDPYIKSTGERSTVAAALEGGGGGSELPEYSEADAGKVLTVDDNGDLEWGTVAAGISQFVTSARTDNVGTPTITAEEVTT